MSDIELTHHFDRMNTVVSELLKGNNPTQIAAITGFKRAEVVELIDEWKTVAHNDTAAQTVEDADTQGQLNVKSGALKLIADIEGKRIGMLQEVGLLDNAELATQIAETEKKQDILVKILKEVTATCPKCKMEVAKRLSQITGVVEPVIIDAEVTSGS